MKNQTSSDSIGYYVTIILGSLFSFGLFITGALTMLNSGDTDTGSIILTVSSGLLLAFIIGFGIRSDTHSAITAIAFATTTILILFVLV